MIQRRAGADERSPQSEVAISERRSESGKTAACIWPEGTPKQWGRWRTPGTACSP